VPRITEEHREARRQQVLDAARACVMEHGLEAVSMEMIIARSGLSTGAVYRYFKGKDDILRATVAEAMVEIGALLSHILADPEPPPPARLVGDLLAAWSRYSLSGVGAAEQMDRMPAAVHGWSYALSDPELKVAMAAGLRSFRRLCIPVVERWKAEGLVDRSAQPDAVAQLILSMCLGFVAQHALAGDVGVAEHAGGVAALTPDC
jgi:AcrR family transcriptional regulator